MSCLPPASLLWPGQEPVEEGSQSSNQPSKLWLAQLSTILRAQGFMLSASRAVLPANGFDGLEAREPDLSVLRSPLTVLMSCPPPPPLLPSSPPCAISLTKHLATLIKWLLLCVEMLSVHCHQVGDTTALLHEAPVKRQRHRDHKKGKDKVNTSNVNNGCFWSIEYE